MFVLQGLVVKCEKLSKQGIFLLFRMSEKKKRGFDTDCIHAGQQADAHRSHLTPIYASSTYTMDNAQYGADLFTGKRNGYVYGRFGNPNMTEVEDKIAALETYGLDMEVRSLLHSSGMAAISTCILSNMSAGQKILSHFSLYGGTQEIMDKVLPPLNVEAILIDFQNLKEVEEVLKRTKDIGLMYIETPANPTLRCVDIEALCMLAIKYDVKTICDNTFATPYLQQPFALGVDFVVHSTTKYLNGHGTAIGGVLLGKDVAFMDNTVLKHHRLLGGNSNGFDAYLLSNGVKTLALRMEKHCANAETIAAYLEQHDKVELVNYLGLQSHPDYELAKKQMKHAGGMMSFELKGGFENGKTFIDNMKLCVHAVSLGTLDTLVSHPASTTHFGVTQEMKDKSGITEGLIRVSVGLENVEDIIADLEQALAKCTI